MSFFLATPCAFSSHDGGWRNPTSKLGSKCREDSFLTMSSTRGLLPVKRMKCATSKACATRCALYLQVSKHRGTRDTVIVALAATTTTTTTVTPPHFRFRQHVASNRFSTSDVRSRPSALPKGTTVFASRCITCHVMIGRYRLDTLCAE